MDKPADLISTWIGKVGYLALAVSALIVYVFFAFYLKETIFFSFDIPRVALIVQRFLAEGSFLTSQAFVEESVWGNLPWGPSLVFFYAFFLNISPDPLVVGGLLAVANILAIVAIIYLGWRFFSPVVGVIAGILLAANPYWFTYTRIIYQPSPVTFFLPLSMLLFFLTVKSKKQIFTVLLPVSWAALLQTYIPTYSFILTSFTGLLFYWKKISVRSFLFGCVVSSLLFVPTVNYLFQRPEYITRYIKAPSFFTPPEKTLAERFYNVASSSIQIPMGGNFRWQTDYAYDDFEKYFPAVVLFKKILPVVFVVSLLWNLFVVVARKEYLRLLILAWVVCPLWSLMLLWVTDMVPRYFLIAIPAGMLLLGLMFGDILNFSKKFLPFKPLFFLLPLVIYLYWILFNFNYNNFVKNYKYPSGWFKDISETSYVFVSDSLSWVKKEASALGCNSFNINNTSDQKEINLWMEFEYPLTYVNHDWYSLDPTYTPCDFVIVRRGEEVADDIASQSVFGPFVAYRKISEPDPIEDVNPDYSPQVYNNAYQE